MAIITGESVQFGTSDQRTVIGIVQSENNNNSAEVVEIKNEAGQVELQKAVSKTNEKTFEAIFLVNVTPPAAGTILTIGTGETAWTGIVTASNITRANAEYTKVSITAQKKDSANLVAYA